MIIPTLVRVQGLRMPRAGQWHDGTEHQCHPHEHHHRRVETSTGRTEWVIVVGVLAAYRVNDTEEANEREYRANEGREQPENDEAPRRLWPIGCHAVARGSRRRVRR